MKGFRVWAFWVNWAAIFILPALCQGAVKGQCSNCHTMHNSEEGQPVAYSLDNANHPVLTATPFKSLLKTDCVGCHSSAGSDTIVTQGDSRTPIVFNMLKPTYPPDGSPSSALAGGNFYWVVQQGDQYGHNVYGISDPDLRLGGAVPAPGGDDVGADPCATCHRTLATPDTGCYGCHVPHHHTNGKSSVTGIDEGWYRFLGSVMQAGTIDQPPTEGVVGIEAPDWEQSPLSNKHNTYQGTPGPYSSFLESGSIDQKCTGCHGLFHNQTTANSTWIRHPVDMAIPDSGEFTGFTTYNPLVPVTRQNVKPEDANFSVIKRGSDMVSCISCHRAHSSPYPAMLRWAYRSWPGTDPYTGKPAMNGCAVCHTNKS